MARRFLTRSPPGLTGRAEIGLRPSRLSLQPVGVGQHAVSPASSSLAAATRSRRFASAIAGAITDSKAQFEKQLMPEDILHLRADSMSIMQDPICEIAPQEVLQYVQRDVDPLSELPAWHPRRISTQITQPFRSRQLASKRLANLLTDRLHNEQLCRTLDIDSSFNMQVYFIILHAWLLHQRLVLEGAKAKKLDEDLFESCWTLVRNWMWLKKVPEYRFDAELQNVQEYMLGACVALDKALERPDILPARLQQVLWANVYSGAVKRDHAALRRLTKYILRQLGLVLQLEGEVLMGGYFTWADFPLLPEPERAPLGRLRSPVKAVPAWREDWRKVVTE